MCVGTAKNPLQRNNLETMYYNLYIDLFNTLQQPMKGHVLLTEAPGTQAPKP